MGLHVALLTQVSTPLGARKEGAVVAWFSVAIPRLALSPSAGGRRWQSISQLDERSRPPRPCTLSAALGTSRPPLWQGVVVAGALLIVEASVVDLLTHTAAHGTFGLVFLLGVLVISAGWGMGLAVVVALASAAVYAYFHVGASGGLLRADVAEAVAVAVFLPIAALATALVGQVRSRALEAEERRHETSRAAHPVSELAQQQASLRRVATLVAQGVPPADVFRAVADELAYAIDVDHTCLVRFESDGSGTIVAAHNEAGLKAMPVGARIDLEGDNVAAMVLSTGLPVRMNTHQDAAGPAAALIRDLGYRSGVGVPVIIDGRLWGTAIVGSSSKEPPPADTESRLRDFAELVATAIANVDSRTELLASRVRIVAAADDARRRFERDLHDGAQQRLVSLGLMLRAVEDSIPSHLPAVKGQVSDIIAGLLAANQELRELSHGLHPTILSRGGLRPAIRSLARRSAVPVELDLDVERRLPECVEVTTYYVAAEALTNAAKHSHASTVTLSVAADACGVRLSVQDDGVGGADLGNGSGLIGLKDRVEAIGGRLQISSINQRGTTLIAEMPLQ
jgi:signal transduction histidine kinase